MKHKKLTEYSLTQERVSVVNADEDCGYRINEYYLIPAPDALQRDKLDEAKDAVIEALREQNDERCGHCKGREEGITFCERVECAMRPVVVALANLEAVRE